MRKYFLLLFFSLGIITNAFCSPSNSMSVSPVAVDATTITASDENSRNNEISTKFNAHDHNDIDQTANTLDVGDATAGNKTITANNADTNKPYLRYDDTNNYWVFSEDGVKPSCLIHGSGLTFEGLTDDAYETTILITDPTADRTITFPNTSFTVGDMQYTDTRHKMVQATRDLTAASGTQAITGAGFAPKGVIIIGGVDNGLPNTWGIAESGGTTWSMGICQDFKMAIVNGSVIIAVQGNYLTPYQNATVASWDSDGITLSWTKVGAPTGTLTFACYFLR